MSIVVPARNEEQQIAQCVRSLLAQQYDAYEVIVVDDESTDGTSSVLRALAANHDRLRVIHGKPLPDGWIGKSWALAQGAQQARGSWLLFTDADTLHEPLAASSAVQYALSNGIRILSLLPTQRFESIGEFVLLPSILWIIAFAIGSLDAINDPQRTDAAIFNGQYLLCERRAYEALGGHEAVRACIAEDYAFARRVKRDGRFPSRLADAADLVRTRMYRSATGVWRGFTKNLYIGVNDDPVSAFAGIALLAAVSPLPEVLLLTALRARSFRKAVLPGLCIAATSVAAEVAMRRSRFPAGAGALFPIGAAATLAIFVNSAFAHGGGGVAWRGRRYGGRE